MDTKEKYSDFLESLESKVTESIEELIQLTKSECKTYREVERFLEIKKKNAAWDKNHILVEIIDVAAKYFETERNGLSVK